MSSYDITALALADLIAYYPLDETSGSVAADASGNGHHGTWDNAVQGVASTIPTEVGDSTAGSFAADAVRRVVLPASLQLNPGDDFTMVGWIRVPDAAYVNLGGEDHNRPVFTIGNLDSPQRCTAHVPNLADDAMGSSSFDYGSTSTGRTYGPDLRDRDLVDVNVFVAAVADLTEQTRYIYVQGQEAGFASASAGPSITLSGGYLGWWTGGRDFERFVGAQAGVAFYRRALTRSEVQRLFCAGDPSACRRPSMGPLRLGTG